MLVVNRVFIIFIITSAWLTVAHAQSTPVAIWAGDVDSEALDWSGSESVIQGQLHSNGGIKIGGSDNQFLGGTTWVNQFDNGGGGNQFDPPAVQGATESWPLNHTRAEYQPGGSAAVAAGSDYHNLSSICNNDDKWDIDVQGSELADGLYWVPCDVVFSASDLTGNFTVISTGKIEISGSDQSSVSAYTDGILFWTDTSDDDAIKLSGSSMSMEGYLSAEQGRIEISGSDIDLTCGLFADRIKIGGSNIHITAEQCGNEPPVAFSDTLTLAEDTSIVIALFGQ